MDDLIKLVSEYGPYVSLAVIVAFLVQGFKKFVPFFSTSLGARFIHFLPIVLGILGGLLLPLDTLRNKVLVGGALGSMSALIYKTVTVTLAKKIKAVAEKVEDVKQDQPEVEEDEAKTDVLADDQSN
jgi:hypothetical protein